MDKYEREIPELREKIEKSIYIQKELQEDVERNEKEIQDEMKLVQELRKKYSFIDDFIYNRKPEE